MIGPNTYIAKADWFFSIEETILMKYFIAADALAFKRSSDLMAILTVSASIEVAPVAPVPTRT